ncbi:PAS domain-containing sensor histidine kinase [Rhizobium sp. KDH_Rht_773_N]
MIVSRSVRALRKRERALAELVDKVPSHIWRLTADGEPIFFNKRMIDYLGLDIADIRQPGMSGLDAMIEMAIHPDDAARFRTTLRHCFASGESFSTRYRLRRHDGIYRWMSSRADSIHDRHGRISQWYGLCHDIDDQIRAEEALQRSERHLQRLIDALPVHICSWTPAGEVSYVSRRYMRELGLSKANFEQLAKAALDLVHPEDRLEVQGRAAHCIRAGEPFMMRYRRHGPDGLFHWTEGRFEPLRDQNGAIVEWYGLSIDVEDQVRVQDALRLAQQNLARASQAASLAELSASIAHEISQPLAAVISSSDVSQRWLSEQPPNIERAQKAVERISESAHSAVEVVGRIRALFKRSETTRDYTALDSVVREARDLMAEEALRRRVRMDVELERNLPPIAFDRVQVQQVLINLIRNGLEAMDSAGDDRVLRIRARRATNAVQIEISDRGPGVEFPDRIFEPFFTTKGQGMGMGLAISRSIVESHGGRLSVEQADPHGATFIFTLPVDVGQAVHA